MQAAAPVVGANALYDGTIVPAGALSSFASSLGVAIPADVAAVLEVPSGTKLIGLPLPAPIAAT